MGIQDKKWFKFTCPQCKTTDTVAVHDKGSSFGGDSWGTPSSKMFSLTVTGGGGREEPAVVAASCNQCKVPAAVDDSIGFPRPSGW